MTVNKIDYDDYLDEDSVSFEKLSHKAKIVKRDKKAAIKAKRKEKMRKQEAYEKNPLGEF